MKLFIITDVNSNNIIAISEYKFHIYDFYIQNNFSSSRYTITKIVNNDTLINDYLILLDDLYITEIYNYTILQKDYKLINQLVEEQRNTVKSTINNLCDVMNNCILNRDEMRSINTTIGILKKNIKHKNLDDFINIKQIIYDFYNIDSYKYLRQMFDDYNNKIMIGGC